MTKKLMKNLISFTLMCAIVVTACVILLAASDGYNDGILGASLSASKNITGDTLSARSSDQISTHTCSQDGDTSDYNTMLRVYAVYHYSYGGVNYSDTVSSQENDTNVVSVSTSPGFGRDLNSVSSAHRAQLYCEGVSSECSLSVEPD